MKFKKKLENLYYLKVHIKESKEVITIKFKINIISKGEKNGFNQKFLALMLLGAGNILFLNNIGNYMRVHLIITG